MPSHFLWAVVFSGWKRRSHRLTIMAMTANEAALEALKAWLRLQRRLDRVNAETKEKFGVTSFQLALLHVVNERGTAA